MRKIVLTAVVVALIASAVVWAQSTVEEQTRGEPSWARLVAVTNWPAVQAVDGTVSVDNLPPVQDVSGTVDVGNLPAVQQVSGEVAVSNLSELCGGQNFAVLQLPVSVEPTSGCSSGFCWQSEPFAVGGWKFIDARLVIFFEGEEQTSSVVGAEYRNFPQEPFSSGTLNVSGAEARFRICGNPGPVPLYYTVYLSR